MEDLDRHRQARALAEMEERPVLEQRGREVEQGPVALEGRAAERALDEPRRRLERRAERAHVGALGQLGAARQGGGEAPVHEHEEEPAVDAQAVPLGEGLAREREARGTSPATGRGESATFERAARLVYFQSSSSTVGKPRRAKRSRAARRTSSVHPGSSASARSGGELVGAAQPRVQEGGGGRGHGATFAAAARASFSIQA